MESKPKITFPLSRFDKGLEAAGIAMILLLWIVTILAYINLPEIIPIHFNGSGVPDNFGTKIHIIILPVLGTVLFGVLAALNKNPQIFNYPVKITAENAVSQYTNATRMLRFLKLAIPMIFTAIIIYTYCSVKGKTGLASKWFLPAILLFTIGPVFYLILKGFSSKNKKN